MVGAVIGARLEELPGGEVGLKQQALTRQDLHSRGLCRRSVLENPALGKVRRGCPIGRVEKGKIELWVFA